MKIIVMLFAVAVVMLGCGRKEAAESVTPAVDSVALPLEFSYKGKFALGSMQNVQTVMACNKRLGELNADIGEFLADSVTLHFADGMNIEGPRDSVVAVMRAFIGTLASLKVEYVTAVPLDNADQKNEWVVQWTDETYTYKNGKVEKLNVHEDYRIEKGKIREVYQYIHKTSPEPSK